MSRGSQLEELCELREQIGFFTSSHIDVLALWHLPSAVMVRDNDGTKVYQITGFLHRMPSPDTEHVSLSCTATCVSSILLNRLFVSQNPIDFTGLIANIKERCNKERLTTTGLDSGNPYTLGMVLSCLKGIASYTKQISADALTAETKGLSASLLDLVK